MRVVKRSGITEEVSFDKVLKRIKVLSTDLDIDVFDIAQKVVTRIYDHVKTCELDELAAHICSSLIADHPDYGTLASRIIISNHHKNTSPSLSETITILYNNVDREGRHNPIVSKELYETVMNHKEKLNSYIDNSRDYNFDYFGFKTLEKAYLMKVNNRVVERPQHMFMRVALGLHGNDIKDALQTYDLMSTKHFVHATPTLFNAGTPRPQCSSCYLLGMEDSIEGIFDTLKECAFISKYAGGIGIWIHDIRARNSLIRGTNGTSTGIVPMLKVFNNTARYINQSGKRNGSIAVYIEPWHGDIEQFLEMKLPQGAEEDRARDLFYALWIPDLFMERVKAGAKWSLMCPDQCPGLSDAYGDAFTKLYETYESEGKFIKQVNAQDLWFKVLASQIETGTPYLCYKDAANMKSNQKNLGPIKSSNLCVHGDTMILTRKGYYKIQDLTDTYVDVWNGTEYSRSYVTKTGSDQKLVTVSFSNGIEIKCTPYHKFYVEQGMLHANQLEPGMKVVSYNLPVIEGKDAVMNAYIQGLYSGKGELGFTITKPEFAAHLIRHGWQNRTQLTQNVEFVPLGDYTLESRVQWLEGFIDGCAVLMNDGMVRMVHDNMNLLIKVNLLLTSMGIFSSVESDYVEVRLSKMKHLQLNPWLFQGVMINDEKHKDTDVIHVVKIVDCEEHADTYCFNEPIEHKGVFNGILAGNCSEIIEYSDKDETAVCNLASICLPTYVKRDSDNKPYFDFDKLHEVVKVVTKNLNKIIDLNYYPVEKTRRSNLRHRPIGLGVQGLADTFILMRYAFDSQEARNLNSLIFETIYHAAAEQSMLISKKRHEIIKNITVDSEYDLHLNEYERELVNSKTPGAYSTFEGSPASQGLLQFDLWKAQPYSTRYDWDALKKDIVTYGMRNSLLCAPMPTASTSQIMGFNECFECITSNIYKRKTLAGEFILVNKYLIQDLTSLGLWTKEMKTKIILNDGSIQNIEEIPKEIRDIYKIVWEIKQKVIIDLAADRGKYICQSQSLNLFVEDPTFQKLSSMHFYAWQQGLKTGMYYLRTRPRASSQKFTIDPNFIKQQKQARETDDSSSESSCLTCSA